MGRYGRQLLTVKCESLSDTRKFLLTCRAVSDKERFGREAYWHLPEHFERTKKGDCDEFALWTWRQFLARGYDAGLWLAEQADTASDVPELNSLRTEAAFLSSS